jgi:hypothetical protein
VLHIDDAWFHITTGWLPDHVPDIFLQGAGIAVIFFGTDGSRDTAEKTACVLPVTRFFQIKVSGAYPKSDSA